MTFSFAQVTILYIVRYSLLQAVTDASNVVVSQTITLIHTYTLRSCNVSYITVFIRLYICICNRTYKRIE